VLPAAGAAEPDFGDDRRTGADAPVFFLCAALAARRMPRGMRRARSGRDSGLLVRYARPKPDGLRGQDTCF